MSEVASEGEYRLMWRSPSSAYAGQELLVPVDSVTHYWCDDVGWCAKVLLFGEHVATFVFLEELLIRKYINED